MIRKEEQNDGSSFLLSSVINVNASRHWAREFESRDLKAINVRPST